MPGGNLAFEREKMQDKVSIYAERWSSMRRHGPKRVRKVLGRKEVAKVKSQNLSTVRKMGNLVWEVIPQTE